MDLYLNSLCEFNSHIIKDLIEELKNHEQNLLRLDKQLKVALFEYKLETFKEELNKIKKHHPEYAIYSELTFDQLLFIEKEMTQNKQLSSEQINQLLKYCQYLSKENEELSELKNQKSQICKQIFSNHSQQLHDISEILNQFAQQTKIYLSYQSIVKDSKYFSQNEQITCYKLSEILKQLNLQQTKISDVQKVLQDYPNDDLLEFQNQFDKYSLIKKNIQITKSKKKNLQEDFYNFKLSLNQQKDTIESNLENNNNHYDEPNQLNSISQQYDKEVCNIHIYIKWHYIKQNQDIMNKFCKLVNEIQLSYIRLINNFDITNSQTINLLNLTVLSVEISDIQSKQCSYKSKLFEWCQKIDNQISEHDEFNSKKRILAIYDKKIENECQIIGQYSLFQKTISEIDSQYTKIFEYVGEKQREQRQIIKEEIITEISKNTVLNKNQIENIKQKINDLKDQITHLNKQPVKDINQIKSLIKQKSDLQIDSVNQKIDFQKNKEQESELIAKIVSSFIESVDKQFQLMQINKYQEEFKKLKSFLLKINQILQKIIFLG